MHLVTSVEFDALVERVRVLQNEIGELVLSRDVLLFDVRPQLESRYWSVIGVVESATLELELETLRLRRKLELLQAADNRDEEPNVNFVERKLDAELKEFSAQVEVAKTKVLEAFAFASTGALSPEDAKRLRALYLQLVKKLHPDVASAAVSDAAFKLKAAVEAYKRCDLAALEALALAVETLAKDEILSLETTAFDELLQRKAALEKSRDQLKTQIETIQDEFPFNVAELLDDSEAIAKRLEELRQKQLELKTLRDRYQERVEEILSKWAI
ncbi:MAG: hypothetical protein J6K25_02835 [Thermoguttaceae bacterium]|nr:hypothetical protein [Thermoguttaceae bacterium]